jgi:peptidoglycan/LPS O-acetylase OafA/YrhL
MNRGWAARIDAATPEHRDRTVDALRAVAIIGVVLGHWLVTALVSDPAQPAAIHSESPLSHFGWLAPVSWFFETLGPFFFAGGYAAARGFTGRDPLRWLASRATRLLPPVLALTAVWTAGYLLLMAAQAPGSTLHTVWSVIGHPLWFLAVYLVLTALTPLLRPLIVRYGLWVALPPLAVVATTDLLRGTGLPTALSIADVLAGWLVPYLAGIAAAEGKLSGRRAGAVLLTGGVTAGALLVTVAGYPASAVGVPGDGWSNLDPPSLFALSLAAAQIGLYLLLRPTLATLLRRPRLWAPVAALNLVAMTVYCWHQSALLLATFTAMLTGRLPGLLDPPTGTWIAYRLALLPALALTLTFLVALFHRVETRPPHRARRDARDVSAHWGAATNHERGGRSGDRPGTPLPQPRTRLSARTHRQSAQ